MSNCFIILASGQSKRFKSSKPKQYILYNNKPIYEHSVDKVLKSGIFKHVILVVKNNLSLKRKYHKNVKILNGGKERSDSSLIALKYAKKLKIKNVLIHDAARPNFSTKLVNKLFKELRFEKCVVPAVKINDSVKYKSKKKIINLNRENIYLTQTPQGFDYKELYKMQNDKSSKITDDANLYISAKKKINFI